MRDRTDEFELTPYQDRLVHHHGQRILMSGRQVGKTETVVQSAVTSFEDGQNVVVLAPRYEMVMQIQDRVRRELPGMLHDKTRTESRDHAGGVIRYESGISDDYDDLFRGTTVDAIVVDEANHVDQDLLFRIEREFRDVLLTATPVQPRTAVEVWADHSPFWDVEHVPVDDAPFIEDRRLDEFRDGMKDERELLEVDAEYER